MSICREVPWRSTWWTMGIGAVAIGVAVGRGTKNASGDLTNSAVLLSGTSLCLIGRARCEVAFCSLTLPFGVFIPLAGFFATVDAGLLLSSGPPWVADGNPSGRAVAAGVGVAALLTALQAGGLRDRQRRVLAVLRYLRS